MKISDIATYEKLLIFSLLLYYQAKINIIVVQKLKD